ARRVSGRSIAQALSRRRAMPDNEQRSAVSFWSASPLLLAVIGLIGTAIGYLLQGYWSHQLEREKFEFNLIAKALEDDNKDVASKNLKFLIDVGLISGISAEKISKFQPAALPNFSTRSDVIGVSGVKLMLSRLGIYKGSIDSLSNDAYRSAVVQFQKS